MKKALSGVLAALVLLSSLPTTMTASALPDNSGAESRNVAHTLYVSTAGNDNTGDGTQDKPFATIEKAKEKGIHTVIDTSGQPFTKQEPFFSKFQKLMEYTDLILLDLKQIDEEQHQILTGCTGKNILELAQYLSEIHKPVWIRHVLVPGGSDKDEYLDRLNAFIQTLKNVERVEVLPYHTLGEYKWKELGMEYPLVGVEPPTKERIENAKRRLGC